jgi:putative peptidoglycan lipid II flippase
MADSPPAVNTANRVARSAGVIMIAFLITKLIGQVLYILMYRSFGLTSEMDSFNAANRVTEMLFNLMAGGALASAFIPTFTGLLVKSERERAWQLASAVANLLFLVLTVISLLAMIFAPWIVEHVLYLLDPSSPAGQLELTAHLLRILLPTVVVFGLSGLVMGILNAHHRFWLPAIAPAMYSIGQIIGLLFLPQSWGIDRLAWATLAGSFLHLFVQFPNLFRLGGRYQLKLGLHMAEVREVTILMGPRVLGVAIVQINLVINTMIALSLEPGSTSALALAFMWMMLPQTAVAQSVAVAAMPTFSAQVALGKLDEMRSVLASAMRGILLLAIPATFGLILIRTPLIQWLYEDGQTFTARGTALASFTLLWFAAGLVGHSLLEVIVRAFYALHDTRTPVTVGVAAMGLNIVFSFAFTALFARIGWLPIGGLALANSLATLIEMLTLLFLLQRRLGGLQGRQVLAAAGQGLLAALGMSAVLLIFLNFAAGHSVALQTLGGGLIGGLVYAGLILLLPVKEAALARGMVNRLLSRLKPA